MWPDDGIKNCIKIAAKAVFFTEIAIFWDCPKKKSDISVKQGNLYLNKKKIKKKN